MSATGSTTDAAVAELPAASVATAPRVSVCPGCAVVGTVTENEVTMDGCAGSTTRVSVEVTRPDAVKRTAAIRPMSCAVTTTVVCWPGSTLAPLVAPVMLTVGGTESSTVMAIAPWAIWPFVSAAVAWIAIDAPGAAPVGT